MALPITINDVDYSSAIQYFHQSETFRRIIGPNASAAINGDSILDDRALKFDLSCLTRPMRPYQLADMFLKISQSSITVEYFSFWQNQEVRRQMRVENAAAALGLLKSRMTDPIITNIPIIFVEI